MRTRLFGLAVILAIVIIAVAIALQKRESPQGKRDDLVAQFVALVADSVHDGDDLQEIHLLFNQFYGRAEMGKVAKADVDFITDQLASYVNQKHITRKELDYFMAEVGYRTYKGDPRYNPDSTVDHPVLNPEAGMVKFGFDSTQFDSTFWREFQEWKKDQGEFSDTATPPGMRR
ncbi:MAG TPA: hypothetical protein VFU38_03330 [Candidatus Krumholzibacteria bacterium]|nr:hypothetical protein [Candidatus Krumholzibacteria bacterium]